MARAKIPDPLARRHLVEKKLAPAQAARVAAAYLEEGRTLEALEFLAMAGDTERLTSLRGEAVAAGDFFLLRAVTSWLDEPASAEEWAALADAAQAAGKERYAGDARRQAEREGD